MPPIPPFRSGPEDLKIWPAATGGFYVCPGASGEMSKQLPTPVSGTLDHTRFGDMESFLCIRLCNYKKRILSTALCNCPLIISMVTPTLSDKGMSVITRQGQPSFLCFPAFSLSSLKVLIAICPTGDGEKIWTLCRNTPSLLTALSSILTTTTNKVSSTFSELVKSNTSRGKVKSFVDWSRCHRWVALVE